MRIYLVRHGQSQANVEPAIYKTVADHAIPLSEEGLRQVRESGVHLAAFFFKQYGEKHPPIRLWCSPYLRTRQTADGVQAGAGDWITDRRENILLCEQQFGLFDGMTDAELAKTFPREHAHYQKCEQFEGRFWARMPLGESRFDVATRIHQAFGTFQRDAQKAGVEDLVVVCHGVTLRAFIMMWCHLTPEWFEAEPNPRNAAIRMLDGNLDRGYIFEGFR